ncbi:MAG: AraC family transcriptional regulator [Pseudomonadota bacterium]
MSEGSDSKALTAFLAGLEQPYSGEALFDHVPDIVYFLKDASGRYIAVNQTLVERCGLTQKQDLIGKRAEDLFPEPLGGLIARQDRAATKESRPVQAQLELHLYPGGSEGWCLTWKQPLRGRAGNIAGLAGISRDLKPDTSTESHMDELRAALDHIHANLAGPLRLEEIASGNGLSAYQLDQRIRSLHGLSGGQYIIRARIDHARHLLRETAEPISQVALACGYGDQAAFTRQFRRTMGLTPRAYRELALPT